jgi:hypothetical protein
MLGLSLDYGNCFLQTYSVNKSEGAATVILRQEWYSHNSSLYHVGMR